MNKEKSITDKLNEVLEKESLRFPQKNSSLFEIYKKFSKLGIDTRSTFTLPLKDTIGRTFQELIKFKDRESISE